MGIFVEKKEEQHRFFEKDSTYNVLSDIELEREARDITRKNIENYFQSLDDLIRKDYFSLYINAIVEQFDPIHSILPLKIKIDLIQVFLENLKV